MSGRLQFVPPTVEELQPLFTQFAIHECIAVGGMGAVYRATQVSVDRPVAFKVLPPVLARDAKFRQRFAMEAKAMARLSHPNIVQLYDFGQTGEITWMAQEWIEGKTVEHVLLEEGSLDGIEAAGLTAQACEGLGYAHKRGIVHRDVKPANLMEDHEGTVKVMDFGLARRPSDGGDGLRAEGEGRFATAQYAAPEIWDLDRQPDHRVDIFALGILLFEALTGERPGEVFRRPSEVKEGLDARFDEIVVRALQRNPERRFQSCAEMTDALREVVTKPARPITTPLQLGGGVALVPAAQPKETPGGPSPRKGKWRWGLGTAVLLFLGLGGWMLASLGPEDEAPEPPPVVSLRESPAPKTKPDEPGQLRRERLARLERMREFDRQGEGTGEPSGAEVADPDAPDGGVEPAMNEQSVERQLAELDERTRTALQDAVVAYHGKWRKAEMDYLVACADQLAGAQEAGDLDAALFWRSEAEAVQRHGEPPGGDEGAPPAAVALRREWRDTLDPLAAPIEEGREHYRKTCEAIAAGTEDGSGQSLLQERLAGAQEFSRFLAFCRREVHRSDGAEVPERAPGQLTERVTDAGKILEQKMAIYERRGDKAGMLSLIKAFGRLLVAEEKDLVTKGKLEDALAVRELKEEMLARLEEIEGSSPGAQEAAPAGPKTFALVEDGKVAESCEWDRRVWRRRGDALENEEDTAELNSRLGIGPGDFSITMRLSMKRIGATWMRLMVGDTMVILDGDSGVMKVERGGGLPNEARGRSLSSNVRAGEPFTWSLERTGEALKVVVDEEELLVADIHDRELGKVHFSSGKARIELEDFILEGTLQEAPPYQILINRNGPRRHTARLQLLPLEDGEMLAMAALWGGGQDGDARDIWMRRSRDGGTKWDDLDQVVSPRDHGGHTEISFAAASDPELDRVWVVYAAGKANQKVYVKEGRNGGRAWSGQEDITGLAKEQGWNVSLAAQGVVLQRNQQEKGRILLPMLAGPGEERGLYLLVSADGKSWRRVGPLIENAWRQAEIMEDETGRVWVATGSRNPGNHGFVRSWVVSDDGGETWGAPRPSTLPDSGHSRGCLALGEDHAGKPVWYYVNVDGTPEPGQPRPNNLTLYGSRDGGRMWKELRRFHFGRGDYPNLVALGPGRVGLLYRRERHSWDTIQTRFVEFDGLWGGK